MPILRGSVDVVLEIIDRTDQPFAQARTPRGPAIGAARTAVRCWSPAASDLAEAADASLEVTELRDTWAEEARLMIELILNRTDD